MALEGEDAVYQYFDIVDLYLSIFLEIEAIHPKIETLPV